VNGEVPVTTDSVIRIEERQVIEHEATEERHIDRVGTGRTALHHGCDRLRHLWPTAVS